MIMDRFRTIQFVFVNSSPSYINYNHILFVFVNSSPSSINCNNILLISTFINMSKENKNAAANVNKQANSGITANDAPAPLSRQLNFDDAGDSRPLPEAQPTIPRSQPISHRGAGPSTLPIVSTASQLNQQTIGVEVAKSTNDLQSLLSLQQETISSQKAILDSMREARSGLEMEIEQTQQLAVKSAGAIRASKAQQQRVCSARDDPVQPVPPLFQPALFKHQRHHHSSRGRGGHGFRGGFNQFHGSTSARHHDSYQPCEIRNGIQVQDSEELWCTQVYCGNCHITYRCPHC